MEEFQEVSMRENLRKNRDRPEAIRAGKREPLMERSQASYAGEDEDLQASKYRQNWIYIWGFLGRFEDTTHIPAMRFTDTHPLPLSAVPRATVQVFSAEISGISGGLQFPLSVYGVIAARDCADRKRNVIFSRERDDCQTITAEDPYLMLTGPSRAILLMDPVFIEVMLKLKGAVECEDKTLNFQAIRLIGAITCCSRMLYGSYTSKLSTLKLTLGSMDSSVEATLSIRVLNGAVPSAFSVIASTRSCEETDDGVLLLGSCDTTMPLSDDGCIKLSRYVVSVPVEGDLVISLVTSESSQENEESTKVFFRAMKTGRSSRLHEVGSCTMEINVAWSPIALPGE